LALRIALSDRGLEASVPELEGIPPIVPPTYTGLQRNTPPPTDAKKAGTLDFSGLTGLYWTTSELLLVLMGGGVKGHSAQSVR